MKLSWICHQFKKKKTTPKSTTGKYDFYHLVCETAYVVNGEKFKCTKENVLFAKLLQNVHSG